MNTFTIKPAKLADAIAEHLQQIIFEGALKPGDRLLPERELALKLDVSRPTLREALDKLIGQGLLTTNAQGAAFVSTDIGKSLRDPLAVLFDTPQAGVDCLELRLVVETAAAMRSPSLLSTKWPSRSDSSFSETSPPNCASTKISLPALAADEVIGLLSSRIAWT